MQPTRIQKRARRTPARLMAQVICLALGLGLAAALSGCAEMPLPKPTEQHLEAPREQSTQDLATEADKFWSAGNAPLCELLYSRLLERGDLDRDGRNQALDRLAACAYDSKHYLLARQALDSRAGRDMRVLGTWAWHDLYLKTLQALGRPDQLDTHQAWILAHTELPFEVRAKAVLAFADMRAKGGDAPGALMVLADLYRQSPDAAGRTQLENGFAALLRDLPQDKLEGMQRQSRGQERYFPQALVLREASLRARGLHSGPVAKPKSEGSAQAGLPALPGLSGPLLAQGGARAQSDQPAALLPTAPGGVSRMALLLPLSGRFAATGQKVLRGAGAAQKALAAQGRRLEVKVINADAPDWREQLAALPREFALVGGPLLNVEALRQLETTGVLAQRAVFAFQAELAPIREGQQAWRFYPGLKDQARVLLDLTNRELGIGSVAVLAPKNRYGQKMAEVFQAEAKARGLRVAATEFYPPDDHPRWLGSVSHLLRVPDGFRRNKNMPLPMPDFGAVFMPEDWTQAEMLASNFHFFEGQHLLFLGPDLWSVGMDNAKELDDTYFQHAACPGAWWPETNGARNLQALLDSQGAQAGQTGQADFWTALGYDFVRLGARLGLSAGWTPAEVNARLAALKDLEFAMAPIRWSADGQARQDLYLFSPRKEGKVLADVQELREGIQKDKSRRERRISTSKEQQKEQKTRSSGSLTRDVQ